LKLPTHDSTEESKKIWRTERKTQRAAKILAKILIQRHFPGRGMMKKKGRSAVFAPSMRNAATEDCVWWRRSNLVETLGDVYGVVHLNTA
jgi:hypothetical protein